MINICDICSSRLTAGERAVQCSMGVVKYEAHTEVALIEESVFYLAHTYCWRLFIAPLEKVALGLTDFS